MDMHTSLELGHPRGEFAYHRGQFRLIWFSAGLKQLGVLKLTRADTLRSIHVSLHAQIPVR